MIDITWFLTAISLMGTILNIRKNILCFSFEISEKQSSRVLVENL